jgi:opacity protein-like surface antigen
MKKSLLLGAVSAALLTAPVSAQTTTSSTSARDRIGQILGSIFGVGTSADASLETQWRLGRKPLAAQRTTFETRVDTDVRSGVLTSATGARLKSDYAAAVDLEARYGSDGTFTTAERNELSDRYGALTQVLTDGGYADGGTSNRAEVSEGRAAFNARVDSAVASRRITRTAGTRLKADYAALVAIESNYLQDGAISASERDDLNTRLDALDARVGDVGYTPTVTAKSRLEAIRLAVPTSGLTASARSQLLVEHGDLVRLEAAYARLTPTSDERAYLESRLASLETRARVRR